MNPIGIAQSAFKGVTKVVKPKIPVSAREICEMLGEYEIYGFPKNEVSWIGRIADCIDKVVTKYSAHPKGKGYRNRYLGTLDIFLKNGKEVHIIPLEDVKLPFFQRTLYKDAAKIDSFVKEGCKGKVIETIYPDGIRRTVRTCRTKLPSGKFTTDIDLTYRMDAHKWGNPSDIVMNYRAKVGANGDITHVAAKIDKEIPDGYYCVP